MRILTVTRVSVGIGIAVAALRLAAPAPLELLDLRILDLRHVMRGRVPPGDEVVIVGVDEASLAKLGRWPWPRAQLADMVDRLTEGGAAAIGFDVVFDQPEQNIDLATLRREVAASPTRPAGDLLHAVEVDLDQDARLARAMRASGRVVLAHFFEFGGSPAATLSADAARIPELSVSTAGGARPSRSPFLESATQLHASIPVLAGAATGAGHVNFLPDPDGIYRRSPLAIRVDDRLLPSFGLEMVRRYLDGASVTVVLAPDGVRGVDVGGRELPVDAAGQLWVNYLGPPHMFRHLSAADVLAGGVGEMVRGRMVLVGFTAAGFDEVSTPFAPVAPGVELQATVIDNMLHGGSLQRPWWVVPAEAAAIVALALAIGLVLRSLRTVVGVAAAIVLALLYLWGTQHLFADARLAVGAVYPLGAFVFCTLGGAVFHAAIEEREKRRIRGAFRLYLNPEVTDMVARDPARLRLGGERCEVTVFFSDIRGFTGISERLEAQTLGELLNEYLGAMTDIVFRHEGVLDKYIGDAVMAFWGAPLHRPDHARRCCLAALDMLAALSTLHGHWARLGLPLLDIRIGINSGEAAVGNFGSPRRFAYTAVGDNVNLASRLEGLNKELGTRVLISEVTRVEIGDEFVCREIDRVAVRGRVQPIAVYELLGRSADDHDGSLARRAARFDAAVAAYRRENWSDAVERLAPMAHEYPHDQAVAVLLARCRGRTAGVA